MEASLEQGGIRCPQKYSRQHLPGWWHCARDLRNTLARAPRCLAQPLLLLATPTTDEVRRHCLLRYTAVRVLVLCLVFPFLLVGLLLAAIPLCLFGFFTLPCRLARPPPSAELVTSGREAVALAPDGLKPLILTIASVNVCCLPEHAARASNLGNTVARSRELAARILDDLRPLPDTSAKDADSVLDDSCSVRVSINTATAPGADASQISLSSRLHQVKGMEVEGDTGSLVSDYSRLSGLKRDSSVKSFPSVGGGTGTSLNPRLGPGHQAMSGSIMSTNSCIPADIGLTVNKVQLEIGSRASIWSQNDNVSGLDEEVGEEEDTQRLLKDHRMSTPKQEGDESRDGMSLRSGRYHDTSSLGSRLSQLAGSPCGPLAPPRPPQQSPSLAVLGGATLMAGVRMAFPRNTDFLAVQEAFDPLAKEQLVRQLASHFPYVICGAGARFCCTCCFQSSGLLLASRHPVIDFDFRVYGVHSNSDALSTKGLLMTKVHLGHIRGTRLVGYIFVTHLQAGNKTSHSELRGEQMGRALRYRREFVQEHTLGGEVTVLDVLCGDLNFDNLSSRDEENSRHELMQTYTDPCRKKPGQDFDWCYGTELRQDRLYDAAVNTPEALKACLEDESTRPAYVVSSEGGRGNRRIDYILHNNSMLPQHVSCRAEQYNWVTRLASLTDHVGVCARYSVTVADDS